MAIPAAPMFFPFPPGRSMSIVIASEKAAIESAP